MDGKKKLTRATPRFGELALIQQIRAKAGSPDGDLRLGIGDDCAILRIRPSEEIVVTTDFSLEGRHFRRDWHTPHSIGHRALARGLSDIAAMGARPVAAFLSLALPASLVKNKRWIDGFFSGLLDLAKLHGVPLAGGDTAQAPGESVLADIVLLGAAPTGKAFRRSNARAGDFLYVTGSLGGAATELSALGVTPKRFARARPDGHHPHLFPEPRLAAAHTLQRRGLANACIDVSDGLSTDLHHLCEASRVGAEIDETALPIHPLAAALPRAQQIAAALHGGEDYELLFTAPPSVRMPKTLGGIPITCIGRITRRKDIVLLGPDGVSRQLVAQGWEHFRA